MENSRQQPEASLNNTRYFNVIFTWTEDRGNQRFRLINIFVNSPEDTTDEDIIAMIKQNICKQVAKRGILMFLDVQRRHKQKQSDLDAISGSIKQWFKSNAQSYNLQ